MDYEIGIPSVAWENLEYIIPLFVVFLAINWWLSEPEGSSNDESKE